MISRFITFLLMLFPIVMIAIKISYLGYLPHLIIPEKNYQVKIQLTGNATRDTVSLKTFLPDENFRQRIYDESYKKEGFDFTITPTEVNKQANWQALRQVGNFDVHYQFSVVSKAVSWEIPKSYPVPKELPAEFKPYLQASDMMPLNHPVLKKLHEELVGDKRNLTKVLRVTFDYVNNLKTVAFKGSTSAVTAELLRQASCNGKGHLLSALLRMSGIPTKLIGGLILETGTKRISHQWIDVWINGNWVSFDPTNGHFASIPANYLKVYEGDRKFFSHSKNIRFNWNFVIKSFLSPPTEIYHLKSGSFNVLRVYELFRDANISLGILKILLMIPVGGLIATFFRNVIGTQTFGTFLPALIAAASYQTGVWWGLAGFCFVIFVLAGVRLLFEKMDLMHTPKLSAMLTIVVILVIGLSLASARYTGLGLERFSLFPIAILTLTTERFSLTIEEKGAIKALWILLQTLGVTFICYLFMSNLFLQVSFLAFPELSLMVIGMNLWLGRWVGLRLTEFYRFRKLIF
ncbi:MAG: hypothetical protein GY786_24915 [Proteobacteria bacterium]|nr:hypothetical protein [Pseudomonadota bacterium]